jgi:uroporphyrinogen-III synthase
VEPVIFYQTVQEKKVQVDLAYYDAVIFSSSSTITSFFEIYPDYPQHLFFYVSGAMTHAKLLEYGVPESKILTYKL